MCREFLGEGSGIDSGKEGKQVGWGVAVAVAQSRGILAGPAGSSEAGWLGLLAGVEGPSPCMSAWTRHWVLAAAGMGHDLG